MITAEQAQSASNRRVASQGMGYGFLQSCYRSIKLACKSGQYHTDQIYTQWLPSTADPPVERIVAILQGFGYKVETIPNHSYPNPECVSHTLLISWK